MAEQKNKTTERTYTIPLRKSFITKPKHARANRAIRTIKAFISRHMNAKNAEAVRIGQELNKTVWKQGIRNPPGKVTVTAFKEDDIVKVELAGTAWVDAVKPAPKTEKGGTLKDKLTGALKPTETETPPATSAATPKKTEDHNSTKKQGDSKEKPKEQANKKTSAKKETTSPKKQHSQSTRETQ
ncbi:50S ribosomal protein L31e [Candidatus Woesearchaeota archaeon]|nr:MAG: 50S ribosomal protein L31e [Candidatus Woesearchaeota archaeon]